MHGWTDAGVDTRWGIAGNMAGVVVGRYTDWADRTPSRLASDAPLPDHNKCQINVAFTTKSPSLHLLKLMHPLRCLRSVELIFGPKLASERNEGDAEQTTKRTDDISFLG